MAAVAPFRIVIPARYASTRLPAKPLADICGKPMIVRVLERVQGAGALETWVATDHAGVRDTVAAAGGAVVMTRADHPSGTDRLAEVAALRGWADDDIVVNVQGDEPLIDPQLINAVAALLAVHPHASMGTAAHPIETLADLANPNVVKVVLDAQGLAHYFSRAPIPHARDHTGTAWWQGAAVQAHPNVAALARFAPLRHIGIYSYRAGFLRQFPTLEQAPTEAVEALEQLRAIWHGHRIAVHITATAPGPGVDTPQDLARVRALLG